MIDHALQIGFEIMGKGMGAVFSLMLIIILGVIIMNRVTRQ